MGDVVCMKKFRSKKLAEIQEETSLYGDRAEAIKESLKKISELMRELKEAQKNPE